MPHDGMQLSQLELDSARAAITALTKLLQKADAPEKTIPLSDAVRQYLDEMRHQLRAKTMVQKRSALERFSAHAGAIDLASANVDVVQAFLDSLKDKDGIGPIGAYGYNGNLREIRALFAWVIARPRQWAQENPGSLIPLRRAENDGIRILTCDQAESLLRYLESEKPALVRYYAIALFAGVRPNGELERIAGRPEFVDEQNGVIRIPASISKTGKARQVSIRPNLAKWLSRFQGPLLPTNHNRDRQAIRKRFGLSQDILRHSAISYLVAAEGSFAMAAHEMGNSETIIRSHYFRVVSKLDAEAFWQIVPAQS